MATEAAGTDLVHVVALLAAGVVAVPIFKRIGLGSVLGYLTAGLIDERMHPAHQALISEVLNPSHQQQRRETDCREPPGSTICADQGSSRASLRFEMQGVT
jgi:hypothetical protein